MNESDYVCLCTVALFPQISPSSPAVTGSHLLTCTSGAFHHKIYFNFHIFIRSIQTVLCWPIREKASLFSVWNDLVRSRRSVWIHWTVYITTCISCMWTFTVCVHEYVCILCTHVRVQKQYSDYELLCRLCWLAVRMTRSLCWLEGQGWMQPRCQCLPCLCVLLL